LAEQPLIEHGRSHVATRPESCGNYSWQRPKSNGRIIDGRYAAVMNIELQVGITSNTFTQFLS
jgi:hypothetical protein